MVHQRVTLHIVQVFGLMDFLDHSIDCFYQYSSGISPAVSDCFFPLQQSGLTGQRFVVKSSFKKIALSLSMLLCRFS